jgi:hypothetical protein
MKTLNYGKKVHSVYSPLAMCRFYLGSQYDDDSRLAAGARWFSSDQTQNRSTVDFLSQ